MYTLYEVAKELKLSYMMVWKLVQRGDIRAVRFGKVYRVSEEEMRRIKTPVDTLAKPTEA